MKHDFRVLDAGSVNIGSIDIDFVGLLLAGSYVVFMARLYPRLYGCLLTGQLKLVNRCTAFLLAR